MSYDLYVVVSEADWNKANTEPLSHGKTLSMGEADKAARGLSTSRKEPFLVVKLQPVSRHRAVIENLVDPL